jgi:hypothetical protein
MAYTLALSFNASYSFIIMPSFTGEQQAHPVKSEATHTLRRMRGKLHPLPR